MSTRCRIFVKIKEPCTLNFNPDLLDASLDNLKETMNWVHPVNIKEEDKYIGIYCHCDGYPDGAGEALKKYFPTYDKAMNLMALGAVTNIDEQFEAFNDTEPHLYPVVYIPDTLYTEYVYLFKNDAWHMAVPEWSPQYGNDPVVIDEKLFKKI